MAKTLKLAALLPAALLSACTGMYIGVQAPDKAQETELTSEDIAARADIRSINAQALTELQDAQRASRASRRLQGVHTQLDRESSSGYQYLLAPQDVLNITVWNHPELNNPSGQLSTDLAGRTINDDGYFFYPYVGRIKAVGRTPAEIRTELAEKLTRYLTEPQVDVSVLSYRGRRAFASGELKSPGPRPITDVPLRVTDLVAQSGGLTEKADLRNAILTRRGIAQPLDLYALYYEGDLAQDVLLIEGDIVTVPERRYDKVFVLGEVVAPQSKVMPLGRYTLSEALSDAGGLNQTTSNAAQVYVLRGTDLGRPQIWHLNAKAPDALILADAFELQPRDVVFVDPAAVTRWSRVLSQILPTSTFLVTGAKNINDIGN
ncbi:MAG: hypothetical protein KER_00128 [Kerstersia gyiorum]|uniref:polysaccharide biosynthesis/export family protein n=1 Tax=Kerstersia gyiorum TaxID=206506 RepID=UPI0030CA5EFC